MPTPKRDRKPRTSNKVRTNQSGTRDTKFRFEACTLVGAYVIRAKEKSTALDIIANRNELVETLEWWIG